MDCCYLSGASQLHSILTAHRGVWMGQHLDMVGDALADSGLSSTRRFRSNGLEIWPRRLTRQISSVWHVQGSRGILEYAAVAHSLGCDVLQVRDVSSNGPFAPAWWARQYMLCYGSSGTFAQAAHCNALIMRCQFGIHLMHSSIMSSAALVQTFLQKLMLDTACPLPYGPLQLGLPPKAMILLTLVFTSQYMDYATDFLVSYGLCGRVVPLPFTAHDCSFNGTQRCQLFQGFCGTFTAASAVDLVISMALELVDLSTRCAPRCVSDSSACSGGS